MIRKRQDNRAQSLYDTFIDNCGKIDVGVKVIHRKDESQTRLPAVLQEYPTIVCGLSVWLGSKKLKIVANTHT